MQKESKGKNWTGQYIEVVWCEMLSILVYNVCLVEKEGIIIKQIEHNLIILPTNVKQATTVSYGKNKSKGKVPSLLNRES